MKHKVKFFIVAGILLVTFLYLILDTEEFVEFWEGVLALMVLGVLLLLANDYCKFPADRSRDTIDWEMEQEEKKRQEEEEWLEKRQQKEKD